MDYSPHDLCSINSTHRTSCLLLLTKLYYCWEQLIWFWNVCTLLPNNSMNWKKNKSRHDVHGDAVINLHLFRGGISISVIAEQRHSFTNWHFSCHTFLNQSVLFPHWINQLAGGSIRIRTKSVINVTNCSERFSEEWGFMRAPIVIAINLSSYDIFNRNTALHLGFILLKSSTAAYWHSNVNTD